MEVIHLGAEHSLLNRFVMEMRDVTIQNDRLRFRRNIERVGEVMAYEISKKMTQQVRTVTTPLGEAECSVPQDKVVLATILRAGLPFHHGFLNYFDYCENAFVSAYRKYKDRLNFDIHIEYIASPDITDKVLIISDPMLATGSSMELAYKALLTKGNPKHIHIASIIASQPASCGLYTRCHAGQYYNMDCSHRPHHRRAFLYRAGIRRRRRFGLWRKALSHGL